MTEARRPKGTSPPQVRAALEIYGDAAWPSLVCPKHHRWFVNFAMTESGISGGQCHGCLKDAKEWKKHPFYQWGQRKIGKLPK